MEKRNDNVDKYIARFPEDIQNILKELRRVIKTVAPEAEEAMRYGVPAFRIKGNMVLYAAFKNHIGFYPEPEAIETFREELAHYSISKGTVRFPIEESVPFELVSRIVRYLDTRNNSK